MSNITGQMLGLIMAGSSFMGSARREASASKQRGESKKDKEYRRERDKVHDQQFQTRVEEHAKDRELREGIAQLQDQQRMASNTVAAQEAETHRITAETRAKRQEAESHKLEAQAKQLEEQTRGMKQKRLAEKHALEAAQDAQTTHSNQKIGVSSIKQGIKYKGHAMVGNPVEEV